MSGGDGFRDRAVFLGWIAGLLLAVSLLWVFTQPVRTHYLLRAVNRALIAMEDTRRVAAPQARPSVPGKGGLFGSWFSLIGSEAGLFVFAVMREGILVPLGALVSVNGKVEEIIPLSGHAEQVLDRLPPGVIRIYIRRIENAAAERNRQ